jgi:flavin reductase (DIM6/NTAB) family NADH-FMN oxidoreductase RutF
MSTKPAEGFVSLDVESPIWERFFQLAPIVLIGTLETDGRPDLAPKHMAMPMGWGNYFGFVCTPRHSTYQNVRRTGVFTVTYPRPSQVMYTSLAASPRCGEDRKGVLQAFDLVQAGRIDGVFVADGYVFLECEAHRIYDDFGVNSLVTGTILAAHVHRDALRTSETDDQDLIHNAPMLAYIHPWRFAAVDATQRFPLPEGMER